MAVEIPKRPLGELVDNCDSVRVPVREADRHPGPYPYYGASGIVDHVDKYLFDGEYLLVAEDGENLRTLNTPVVFLARGKFWVNNHAHVVKANRYADTRYLVYALTATHLGGFLTGSTMPKLTQGNLSRIPIPVPHIADQHAIASILGTLDDKIELNRQMNVTLETMARALFKSWFIDCDPVRAKAEGRDPGLPADIAALFPDSFQDSALGKIPKGWRVSSIGSIADVIDCLHSKKPERRVAGLPLLQLTNIRDDGLIDMRDEYLISEHDYREWVSRIEASPGDCVITNVGRVGAVAQMPRGQKAALGRNMTAVRCKPSFPFPTVLIECLLSEAMSGEIARKTDVGTILDALNVRNIPNLRFVQASDALLECFESKVRSLRAGMEQHLAESRILATLRDTLLPRLMSGELHVVSDQSLKGRAH